MAGVQLVLVLAMAIGTLPVLNGGSPSHNPLAFKQAEAARHAALGASAVSDHGHVHDEGSPEEQSPGHLHGHNPTDHSHQTAAPVGALIASSPSQGRAWRPHGGVWVHPGPSFPIERPPRSLTA